MKVLYLVPSYLKTGRNNIIFTNKLKNSNIPENVDIVIFANNYPKDFKFNPRFKIIPIEKGIYNARHSEYLYILEHLSDYDYIYFIDDDMYFTDLDKVIINIHNLMEYYDASLLQVSNSSIMPDEFLNSNPILNHFWTSANNLVLRTKKLPNFDRYFGTWFNDVDDELIWSIYLNMEKLNYVSFPYSFRNLHSFKLDISQHNSTIVNYSELGKTFYKYDISKYIELSENRINANYCVENIHRKSIISDTQFELFCQKIDENTIITNTFPLFTLTNTNLPYLNTRFNWLRDIYRFYVDSNKTINEYFELLQLNSVF